MSSVVADQAISLDQNAIEQANRIGNTGPGHTLGALSSPGQLHRTNASVAHDTAFLDTGHSGNDATLGMAGLGKTGLGLIFVIGLIFACSALLKRFGPYRRTQGQPLRVVASQAVGQRERVVVVEVDETWLVLGVAPGSVNTLHTLPAKRDSGSTTGRSDVAQSPHTPSSPPSLGEAFSDNLRRALSRFSRNDRNP